MPATATSIHVASGLLGRNAVLNLLGQVAPLAIGAAALPAVVRGLGVEQFGLLSLSWTILGYFAVLDLGLGPATTKYVAEALGQGDLEQAGMTVTAGLFAQALLGLAGGIAMLLATPLLGEQILSVPPGLVGEATLTFRVLAISMPLVLLSSSLIAVLQAAQRFDLINAIRVPSSASTYLLPLVGVFLGLRVSGIVALIVGLRLFTVLVLLLLTRRLFPTVFSHPAPATAFRRLFQYGGWMSLSSAANSIMIYLDRFMIGALLSTTAVGYYTVPSEIVNRLSIIPMSLAMTLFPAFSVLDGTSDRQRLAALFARSVNYLLLGLTPVVLGLALFGEDALRIWLGQTYADQGGVVLRILSIGALASLLAYVPVDFLKGIGRPDLPAKIQLLELPVSIVVTLAMTILWGLPGAAAAWSLRVLLNAVFLFAAAMLAGRVSPRVFLANGILVTALALILLTGIAVALREFAGALPLVVQSAGFLAVVGLFSILVWRVVLDALDRGAVARAMRLWR